MKQKKADFLMRRSLLCAVCAALCAGCGSKEEEHVQAIVPVVAEWVLEEQSGDAGKQESEDRTTAETADADNSSPGGKSGGTEFGAKAGAETETPLLEQLFTYEIDAVYWWDETYLVITGIAGEYRDDFWVYMEEIREKARDKNNYGSEWIMLIPSDINGMPVRKIAEDAFADEQMYGVIFPDTVKSIGEGAFQNSGLREVIFSENLEYIGARAFENCHLSRVALPDKPLMIGERAFAENPLLWTALIP
ncbi:MAG: leucine-rich repeat domain-containing protein, partial [Lachnospiraceae bacterium]|nr:leucine-rich repeat domain-containing protein [Lachnospiraceae bacterium]